MSVLGDRDKVLEKAEVEAYKDEIRRIEGIISEYREKLNQVQNNYNSAIEQMHNSFYSEVRAIFSNLNKLENRAHEIMDKIDPPEPTIVASPESEWELSLRNTSLYCDDSAIGVNRIFLDDSDGCSSNRKY